MLRQLWECFREQESRLKFLHSIDQKILNDGIGLEEICSGVLREVISFCQADSAQIFLDSGAELLQLVSYPSKSSKVLEFDANILNSLHLVLDEIDLSNGDTGAELRDRKLTRMILPIRVDQRIWGLMCIQSVRPRESTLLADTDLQDFLQIVCGQLAIAVQVRNQNREVAQLSKIQNELFNRELDIKASLESLLTNIQFALPDLGPLRIDPIPDIQILFYRYPDDFLTIKATSGPESVDTRVFVKNSISGMLIENPQLPFFLCDPRDSRYRERYKSYLGKDQAGEKKKEIRTELVLPLLEDRRIIGVVNLESDREGAFTINHIQAMLRLAERISPIINALQKRIEKVQVHDITSTYSVSRFLARFGSTYTHKMVQPLKACQINFNDVRKAIKDRTDLDDGFLKQVTESLDIASESLERIEEINAKFCAELPQYLMVKEYKINSLINAAINDLNPSVLDKKYKLEIVFKPTADYSVLCSLLLREHLFDMLNNSMYSIWEKMTTQPNHEGRIVIETSLREDREEKRNKRCEFRILDNGTGVDAAELAKIPSPGYTTKRSGTGYGLFGALQYLKGVGGGLTCDSKKGEFFEVRGYLNVYGESLGKVS